MKTLAYAFITVGLVICLSAFLAGCTEVAILKHVVVDGARNGNGGFGNKAAAPSCFIETESGGRFVDLKDKQCLTSSPSPPARR